MKRTYNKAKQDRYIIQINCEDLSKRTAEIKLKIFGGEKKGYFIRDWAEEGRYKVCKREAGDAVNMTFEQWRESRLASAERQYESNLKYRD